MADIDALTVWAGCQAQLRARGFTLRQTTDFNSVPDLLDVLEKTYLTPKMSPLMNDFTEENCFWSVLEADGEPVAAMAARLERLGNEAVGTYWPRIMRRQYGHGTVEKIASVAPPLAAELSGRLAYYGDLIVRPDHRKLGRKLEVFVRAGVILGEIKWRPDWHYAFVTERHYRAGAAAVYGFTRALPNPQTWINAPPTRSNNEACIYIPSREFRHLVACQARALEEL